MSAEAAAPGADELAIPYWLTATAEAASATFGRMMRRLPGLLRQAWRLAWRTNRRDTLAVVALQLAAGVASGVGLVNIVGVLNGLLQQGPTPERIRAAVPSILVMVGAGAIRTVLASLATAAQGRLSPQVSQAAELRLLELTTRADLATFDDSDWRDSMQRARDRGIDAAQRVVDHGIELGTNLVSLAAAGSVLAVLHPVLVPLLVLAVLPNGWASVRSARLGYRQKLRLSAVWRRKYMLADLLADREPAPEVRAFTLRTYLLAEVRRLLEITTREYQKVSTAQARTALLGHALGSVATGLAYAALIALLLTGRVELAVGGAAAYAINTGINALTQVAFAMNHIYEQGLYFGDYEGFCTLARERGESVNGGAAPAHFLEMTLDRVTFSYPGAEHPAVRELSLTVRRGQTIALVGENGSGKSTVAKLLAALYRPDEGRISWDGVDIATLDPDSVRERVAVVMQEPTRWPLSARANITVGRHARPVDERDVEAAARQGDAHDFITELARGYDTLLSRHFTDGADLSGGQWQRLAVSRAFYRDAM
jgi:ATP-binding cassette subfamily B protein